MIDAIIDDGYIVAGKLDRNSVISKTSCCHLIEITLFLQNCILRDLFTYTFPLTVMIILLVRVWSLCSVAPSSK